MCSVCRWLALICFRNCIRDVCSFVVYVINDCGMVVVVFWNVVSCFLFIVDSVVVWGLVVMVCCGDVVGGVGLL